MNTNTDQNIPATRNAARAFHGTMRGFYGAAHDQVNDAWRLAVHIVAAMSMREPRHAAYFLDGAHGRYFADEVLDQVEAGKRLNDALHNVSERWMKPESQHQLTLAARVDEALAARALRR